jgi:hypothetical protein
MPSRRAPLLRLLACATLALAASAARANGGEVVREYGDSGGRIRPLQESVIRLVREDLAIDLVDPDHYAIRADYVLSNPGPEKELQYGVPIEINTVSYRPRARGGGRMVARSDAEMSRRVRKMAGSVRVTLGGTSRTCTYADGWCVLPLRIPHGEKIPLRLTYVSEYWLPFYSDDDTPDEWTPTNLYYRTSGGSEELRIVKYPLAPAGTWAGTPEQLTIAVTSTLGFRVTTKLNPDDRFVFHREVDGWRAVVEDANLRELDELVVPVALRARDPRTAFSIRASSSIPPSGKLTYGPENLLDSRYATAWCVNTPSHGVGEWVELELRGAGRLDNQLDVIGGYAKTERSFQANGRVKKLRASACGGGPPLAVASLPDRFADDMWEWIFLEAHGNELGSCLRLEIAEVEPGDSSDDVCLTELHVRRRD